MEIRIENLKKNFGSQEVINLKEMSFEPGLTCIMGRNGCGKTTLLNIISGHMTYEKGDITYNGQAYSKSLAKDITLVEQKPLLFDRSVEENIAYPLKVRRWHKKEVHRKVEEMLRLLDIENLRHKRATALSGGESQKVAIARALVFGPSLLMLDEPTSNIDRHSKAVIEEAVQKHAKNGNTVLWVTHDKNQAEQLDAAIIEFMEEV